MTDNSVIPSLYSDGSRLAIGGDLDMVNLFTATPSGSKSTGYEEFTITGSHGHKY